MGSSQMRGDSFNTINTNNPYNHGKQSFEQEYSKEIFTDKQQRDQIKNTLNVKLESSSPAKKYPTNQFIE